MNKLILDTDGGVDDAQALLMLIAAGHMPAVTPVEEARLDRLAAMYTALNTYSASNI